MIAGQQKALVLFAVCLVCTVVVWSLGPIAQDERYHDFADKVTDRGVLRDFFPLFSP
jgi:hypothetical protein